MRAYWDNCLTHFDADVDTLISGYFGADTSRHCLLIGAAGFDPRARIIPDKLAAAMGARLQAIFVREERGNPASNLKTAADNNTRLLLSAIPMAEILEVDILSADDAPVGGTSIIKMLNARPIPTNITDVVLDLTAFSIGIGYPVARFLLELCERRGSMNFHVLIASDPELEACISSETTDRPSDIRGFAPLVPGNPNLPLAQIWIPQLSRRKGPALEKIRIASTALYRICPILPFPAQDPRRSDDLLAEFGPQLRNEWAVHPKDIIYASESNPVDCYRTLSTLKRRFFPIVAGIFRPQIVLSPLGNKVMALGSLMAAIEHDLTVQYVETLRYDLDTTTAPATGKTAMVHVWLHGSIYQHYAA